MNASIDYPYTIDKPLLTVENVSVGYGQMPVLVDVNIQMRNVIRPGCRQGQVIAILGPSGIGKTTLFRVLAGLEEPDKGRVLITENQIPVKKGMVGVVGQSYPMFEDRTVVDNLILASRLAKHGRSDAKKRAKEMLARFDLTDQGDLYPKELSGGQRQRAAIAQQLLNANKTLFMDEPFSGQDFIRLQKTCEVIQQVADLDELFSIVLITHDIGAALTVADTVWVMGRVRDIEKRVLGAQIVKIYDLMERGIAWRPNKRTLPQFVATRNEIEALFPSLL